MQKITVYVRIAFHFYLQQGDFLVVFVCLLATLLKHLLTDSDEIYGGVKGGKRNKGLKFGSGSPC